MFVEVPQLQVGRGRAVLSPPGEHVRHAELLVRLETLQHLVVHRTADVTVAGRADEQNNGSKAVSPSVGSQHVTAPRRIVT